jgi:very-short-patch-repair endonuclease
LNIDDLTAGMRNAAELERLNARWRASTDKAERWDIIRAAYKIMTPILLQRRTNPYFLDWSYHRTPIEELAWIDIRNQGLPFYPQFPVLRFFLDFADPVQQIAVELDGAKYHDEQRDAQRDRILLEHGWRTFRIPGKRSLASGVDINSVLAGAQNEVDAVYQLTQWGLAWSEGFFWALGFMFYRKPGIASLSASANREAALRILSYHQLVEFPIEDDE